MQMNQKLSTKEVLLPNFILSKSFINVAFEASASIHWYILEFGFKGGWFESGWVSSVIWRHRVTAENFSFLNLGHTVVSFPTVMNSENNLAVHSWIPEKGIYWRYERKRIYTLDMQKKRKHKFFTKVGISVGFFNRCIKVCDKSSI